MIHKFLRRGVQFALLACLAAVGLATPAIPASAEVTSLTRCQQQITAPGTYRLDADVTGRSVCLTIAANDVTLILNGHTITGPGFGDVGIKAEGSGATILGPGTVSGWVEGIVLAGGSSRVRGVTASGNARTGIILTSAGNDVRGNVTTGNGDGIVASVLFGTGNTIIGNFAHGNPQGDLVDQNPNCDSNVWRGNDFGTANQSCIN